MTFTRLIGSSAAAMLSLGMVACRQLAQPNTSPSRAATLLARRGGPGRAMPAGQTPAAPTKTWPAAQTPTGPVEGVPG